MFISPADLMDISTASSPPWSALSASITFHVPIPRLLPQLQRLPGGHDQHDSDLRRGVRPDLPDQASGRGGHEAGAGHQGAVRAQRQLNEEKAAIQLEAARETIRGNILRAVSPRSAHPPLPPSPARPPSSSPAREIAQSEKASPLVQDIKSDADALIAMVVENLLSITKIRDGTMPLNKQEGRCWRRWLRRRPHHHPPPLPDFPVALNLSEDILYLPMEPMLIKQVIVNLLENAIRHSGDREHIQLHLFRQG